jgi:hypothetical protein
MYEHVHIHVHVHMHVRVHMPVHVHVHMQVHVHVHVLVHVHGTSCQDAMFAMMCTYMPRTCHVWSASTFACACVCSSACA